MFCACPVQFLLNLFHFFGYQNYLGNVPVGFICTEFSLYLKSDKFTEQPQKKGFFFKKSFEGCWFASHFAKQNPKQEQSVRMYKNMDWE